MSGILERACVAIAVYEGEDPDMGTWCAIRNEPGPKVWEIYKGRVTAVLNSLRDAELPGLVSLSMNEVVDAILNENPE